MMRDDPEPTARWGVMVGVSIAIHALVLGGAVMLASGSGPRRTLYTPSLSVSLMGPGETGLAPGGGPSKSVSPPPKVEKTEEKAPPKPEVSAVEPIKPKPEAKETVEPAKPKEPKKAEKTVPVLEKKPKKTPKKIVKKTPVRKPTARPGSTKKPKAVPSRKKVAPEKKRLTTKEEEALARIRSRILAKADEPGATGGPSGGGGFSTRGASGAGLNIYKNEIARIFYAAWVLPQSLQAADLKATLVIHIDRKGQIVKTEVERSSGNRFFDESVMRAVAKVQAAGGLPPLPPEYTAGLMAQGLLFDPEIRRGLTR
ncbi:MAG: energy transducer TonB [Nitrospinota bacterium]